jgi:hypothetical protein
MDSSAPPGHLPIDPELAIPQEHAAGPTAVLIPATHPFAQRLLPLEEAVFPEAPLLFGETDLESLFHFLLVVVDRRVCHVMRVSGPGTLSGRVESLPFFVSDLLAAGQIGRPEIDAYYSLVGARLERMISVDTNFKLGPRVPAIRSADLAYLTLCRLGAMTGTDAILAHLNEAAMASLGRAGFSFHPLAGRADLRTPTVAAGGAVGFDPAYTPACLLLRDPTNAAVFDRHRSLTPPILVSSSEGAVVDLRRSVDLTAETVRQSVED